MAYIAKSMPAKRQFFDALTNFVPVTPFLVTCYKITPNYSKLRQIVTILSIRRQALIISKLHQISKILTYGIYAIFVPIVTFAQTGTILANMP